MNEFLYIPYRDWLWGEVSYHAVPVRMGVCTGVDFPPASARWLIVKQGFD